MNSYNSNTFKCKSSNKVYTLLVTLFTKSGDPKDDLQVSLDAADIEEVTYESKLNDLLLRGKVIYVDKYAMVDKFINQHFGYCSVMFAENKRKNDNDVGIGDIDEQHKFMHNFIISNIKVLQRNFSIIKYEIDLVSMNWFKCTANIYYTNYGKKPEPIFQIMKNCLSYSNLATDKYSFGRVNSPVVMNYITQQNDNAFTIVGNLLHKLYYWPTYRDDSMKFIAYDAYDDMYRLIDIKDTTTFVGSYTTMLSFFKSNIEGLIMPQPTNIGSFMNAASKQNVYFDLFDKTMHAYDYSIDQFWRSNIQSDETVNYLNNRIGNGSYSFKYQKMFDTPGLQHKYVGSYWNNDLNVYDESVIALEENNSFIINTAGDIRRQPGSVTEIAIDRSLTNVESDNRKELEKMKKKYKAFEGLWLASKVKNIIQPANVDFRQQVVLFRNFSPPEKTQ